MKNKDAVVCSECIKNQKKIKIVQSDYQFQLRKLAEDKSTEKALYELSTQKQIRKWQDKFNKQKIDHEEDGKKWLAKIDQINNEREVKLAEMKNFITITIAAQKQKNRLELQAYKSTTEQKYFNNLQQLQQKNLNEINSLNLRYQNEFASLIQANQLNLVKLKKQNQERQKQKKSQFQSQLLGIQSQKNAEVKAHLKTQQQAKLEKNRFYSQIYELRSKIFNLESTIRTLQNTISQKDSIIAQKLRQIIVLQNQHQLKILQINQFHQKRIEELQAEAQQKIRQAYENQLRSNQQYQQSILKMQQTRQSEAKLYEYNMNEIKNCIENRPSRLQDIEQILALKQKFCKKQRQCQSLQKQLRTFQLQLENKQDTYNKIFIPVCGTLHNNEPLIRKKQFKLKRAGKSVTTVRQILHTVNSNNLPSLNNIQKRFLPPKTNKIL